MAITRSEILANLRAKIARNEPIIGGGAGTGHFREMRGGRRH